MNRLIIIFASVLIILIAYVGNSSAIILTYTVCLLIAGKNFRNKSNNSFHIYYLYYTIFGCIAHLSYIIFCGNTFAPYHDDSFYYNNIQSIASGSSVVSVTLYEYFMFICSFPVRLLFDVNHLSLLPFNWLMGGYCIKRAIEFSEKVTNVRSKKPILCCLILLNASFIEGTIHLYRDALMCVLFITALDNIYMRKYTLGIILTLLTGFVRGANAMILFFYLILQMSIKSFNIKRTYILYVTIALMLIAVSMDKYLNLGGYLRGSMQNTSSHSISSEISNRYEIFKGNSDTGGIMSLLNTGNPLCMAVAVPLYMISPIKIGPKTISENYIIRDEPSYTIFRVRVESMWEFISCIFYSYICVKLFIGLYYWTRDKNNFCLLIIFFIMVLCVTFISMQHRHKMMFILMYPIAYNYYLKNITRKKESIVNFLSYMAMIVVLAYNFM